MNLKESAANVLYKNFPYFSPEARAYRLACDWDESVTKKMNQAIRKKRFPRFFSPPLSGSIITEIGDFITIDERRAPYSVVFFRSAGSETKNDKAVILSDSDPAIAERIEEDGIVKWNKIDAKPKELERLRGRLDYAYLYNPETMRGWGGRYPDVDEVLAAVIQSPITVD